MKQDFGWKIGSSARRTRKPPSLHTSYPNRIKDGQIELRILSQPEEQHRARYMTEGSRGAVKDRRGTGFPTVKLFGYDRPLTLQVFIGSDGQGNLTDERISTRRCGSQVGEQQGKIQPHLFYQACKVSGKNCTPCNERVIDGTTVIEICMVPEKEMTVSCDCIGILKERNVDVEQRLPYFNMTRAKKKNTRCRMIFRVTLSNDEGRETTLQVVSLPILCTQPPGVPEICKKSLNECSVSGDADLFIIGKNFLKDTQVLFQEGAADDMTCRTEPIWQKVVDPEKEFLHQTHLVCKVPPYANENAEEAVKVQLLVKSGGKTSEPHTFTYLPARQAGFGAVTGGRFQPVSQSAQGSTESATSLENSRLLSTILQIPGVQPFFVSQPDSSIISLPITPMQPLSVSAPVSPVATDFSPKLRKPALKMYTTHMVNSARDSSNPRQVLIAQKAVRKPILPPWSTRQRALALFGKKGGSRLPYSKGKHHLVWKQQRVNSPRPFSQVATSNEQVCGDSRPLITTFKQELPSEMDETSLFMASPSTHQITEMEQNSSFVPDPNPSICNSTLFAPQTLSPHDMECQPSYTLQTVDEISTLDMRGSAGCFQVTMPSETLASSTHPQEVLVHVVGCDGLNTTEIIQQQQAEMEQMRQGEFQCQISQSSMPTTMSLPSDMIQTQLQPLPEMMGDTTTLQQSLLESQVSNNCQNLIMEQLCTNSLCSPMEQGQLLPSESLPPTTLQPDSMVPHNIFGSASLDLLSPTLSQEEVQSQICKSPQLNYNALRSPTEEGNIVLNNSISPTLHHDELVPAQIFSSPVLELPPAALSQEIIYPQINQQPQPQESQSGLGSSVQQGDRILNGMLGSSLHSDELLSTNIFSAASLDPPVSLQQEDVQSSSALTLPSNTLAQEDIQVGDQLPQQTHPLHRETDPLGRNCSPVTLYTLPVNVSSPNGAITINSIAKKSMEESQEEPSLSATIQSLQIAAQSKFVASEQQQCTSPVSSATTNAVVVHIHNAVVAQPTTTLSSGTCGPSETATTPVATLSQCVTSLSCLSDKDLLSFINPSTFDNM